jgi:hypothetical protein
LFQKVAEIKSRFTINRPVANFTTGTADIVNTGYKFATGVNDTGGKFSAGVNDPVGKNGNNTRLITT